MGNNGWVKAFRDEIYDDLWTLPEPYDSRSAYEWVKRSANFRDHTTVYNGRTVTIKRGQLITSIRKLADAFNWKKDKVRKWFDLMQQMGKLEVESNNSWTRITVVRYGLAPIFQEFSDSEGDTEQTESRHAPDTPGDSTGPQYKKNKEEYKEVKEEKRNPAPPEPPTEESREDDDNEGFLPAEEAYKLWLKNHSTSSE